MTTCRGRVRVRVWTWVTCVWDRVRFRLPGGVRSVFGEGSRVVTVRVVPRKTPNGHKVAGKPLGLCPFLANYSVEHVAPLSLQSVEIFYSRVAAYHG